MLWGKTCSRLKNLSSRRCTRIWATHKNDPASWIRFQEPLEDNDISNSPPELAAERVKPFGNVLGTKSVSKIVGSAYLPSGTNALIVLLSLTTRYPGRTPFSLCLGCFFIP